MASREEMKIVVTAQDQTAAAFNALRGHIKSTQATIGLLKTSIAGAGLLGGYQLVRNAIKDLDDIGDAAERVGLSTNAFQAIRFQLGQFGGDAEMADRAMDKLSDSLSEAANSSNDLARLFNANGVALRNQNGELRTLEEVLPEIGRLFMGIGSQADKVKLSFDLFGKGAGPKMITALEDIGRRGMGAIITGARQVGAVTEEEVIKKGDEIDKKWRQIETSVTKTMQKAIIGSIEALGEGADKLGVLGDQYRSLAEKGKWWEIFFPSKETIEARINMMQGKIAEVGNFPGGWGEIPDVSTPGKTIIPKKGSGAFASEEDAIKKRIALVNAETATIGMSEEARERHEAVTRLEAAALKELTDAGFQNAVITNEMRARIDEVADAQFKATKGNVEAKKQLQALNEAAMFFGNQAATALEDLFDRTKSGSEMATQALKAFRNQLLQALLTGEGAFGKILGLGGSGGGAGGLAGALMKSMFPAGHSGGTIGELPFNRSVSPFVFAGAGRFHTGGIVGDEMPVIARKGEEIGWPSDLARKYGGARVNVNVINQNGSDVGVQQQRNAGGGIDLQVMIKAAVSSQLGRGEHDGTLAQRYGVKPRVGPR